MFNFILIVAVTALIFRITSLNKKLKIYKRLIKKLYNQKSGADIITIEDTLNKHGLQKDFKEV